MQSLAQDFEIWFLQFVILREEKIYIYIYIYMYILNGNNQLKVPYIFNQDYYSKKF